MRTLLPTAFLAFCALLAGVLPAAAQEPIRIYGLELEAGGPRERLLIFAEAPPEPRLVEKGPRTLVVVLPGAVLDASAPTRVVPDRPGTVERVTAFEEEEAGVPEVRVVVQRQPGPPPEVQRRASIVALDFPARPQPRQPAAARTVRVAYRQAPLPRVVADLARATGETLVFDDTLRGRVTVEGPGRMTRGEARTLLDSVLLLRGFAAVPAPGGGLKVVPLAGAPGPWVAEGKLADTDAPLTTLLHLRSAAAEDVVEVVRPLLGAQSLAIAYPPTNGLILAGPSSRLERLRTAIAALDDVEPGRNVLWRLRYASAEDVADQLEEILGDDVLFHASADARTNRLLLQIRPDAVERARSIVDRLDRPAQDAGEFQVIRIDYADPEQLAERLQALQQASVDESAPGQHPGLQGLDFAVAVDRATHSLVVRAAPETFDAVLDVVSRLDREPPRVRVEASIAQVTLDNAFALGFDWLLPALTDPQKPTDLIAGLASLGPGGVQTLPSQDLPVVASFTRTPILLNLVDTLGNPILNPLTGQPVVIQIPRESFSLTMNDRTVDSKVLMRPQLLVASGEEHEIFSGDNVPVIQEQAEPGPAVQTRQNVERRDVGTTLRVRPTIGQEGGVFLDLEVETSRLSESVAGDVTKVGPSVREVRVQTKLHLDHGEVAVIATSAEPQVQKVVRGPPWLRDLPFFGVLFRRVREQSMRRYLLVSVEADIVRPEREALARKLRESLAGAGPTAASARLD